MPAKTLLQGTGVIERTTLGSLLNRIRTQNGLTLKEMSAKTDIPFSTLAKVEQGRLSLTYDKLEQIARGLGISMSAFLAEQAQDNPVTVTARRSSGAASETLNIETDGRAYTYLCTELTSKLMVPMVVKLDKRSPTAPAAMSAHSGEEFVYVIEGAIDVLTEFYAPTVLAQGQWMYLDSTMRHSFQPAEGQENARILCICASRSGTLAPSASGMPRKIAERPSLDSKRKPSRNPEVD